MKIFVVCFGLLALAKLGECQLVYVEPTADGDVGTRQSILEGAAGTVYTIDVTTANAYAITTQVPTGVLEIATATSGAVSVVTGQTIDSAASTTHVLTVTAGDGGGNTGTITFTLTVYGIFYTVPVACYDLRIGTAAGTIHTAAATGATTMTYAQTGSANTGYTFTAGTGALANDALITSATTAQMVTTVITATEAHGTAGSAMQTVYFCINGACACGLGFSGASSLAAGILTIASAFMLQKLK